jgi:hypothetical protein
MVEGRRRGEREGERRRGRREKFVLPKWGPQRETRQTVC